MLIAALLGCAPADPGPPNLLLITLDTVRADHVGAFGGVEGVTPNLDALARAGVAFDAAVSPANESALAHAALLTGRWPSAVASAPYADYVVPPAAELVSERLRAAGYRTAAFVGGGHVDERFGFQQGWDAWGAERGFGSFGGTVPRALAWLDEQDGAAPWFLWVHGYDAHLPYRAPGPWDVAGAAPGDAATFATDPVAAERIVGGRYDATAPVPWFTHVSGEQVLGLDAVTGGRPVTDAERAWLQARYDTTLGYLDAQVGRLLAAVAGRDDVLVVAVGDHGEDLLDHGFVNHRHGLHESCIRVPLIVAGPGFAPGRHAAPVGTRDVYATLLAAAGVTRAPTIDAVPLQRRVAGLAADEAVFSEGVAGELAVREGRWKRIRHGVDRADPESIGTFGALYDLEVDPDERTEVAALHPEAAAALDAALLRWRRGIVPGRAPAEPIPPWAREELRARGYW